MEDNAVYRKEGIIYTTIDVIDELGIQSLSTREVAKRQGISQGTVFKYFPKKSDLLLAVLNHFSQYDSDLFQSTKLKRLNSRDVITYYIDSYVLYYENYPAITAIDQLFDPLFRESELSEKVKSIFNDRLGFMRNLIENAQESGTISKTVSSAILTDIISSTVRGICLKWRMNNYSFSLREQGMQAINTILDAFSIYK